MIRHVASTLKKVKIKKGKKILREKINHNQQLQQVIKTYSGASKFPASVVRLIEKTAKKKVFGSSLKKDV